MNGLSGLLATQRSGEEEVPDVLLQSEDPVFVARFMRFFILEARREDGKQYRQQPVLAQTGVL